MKARRVRMPPGEIDQLADEIAELSAQIDSASHRLLNLIRRFDESSGWAEQGALTCAHWLSWRIGLDIGAAREHVRVARALASLPLIDDALRRGQLSYSKIRAVTRIATAETEPTLLMWARSSTASQLERICRKYRTVRRLHADTLEDEAKLRYVRVRETDSGMVRIEVQLPPEEAAVVLKALDTVARRCSGAEQVAAVTREVSAETSAASVPDRIPPEPMRYADRLRARLSRADGLVAVAEAYLSSSSDLPRTPLPPETAARLSCDASVTRILEDERGTPLDIGRRTRTIPPAMRRALLLRDRGCRFPGCTNRLVDGHHVVPWSKGGPTRLSNLVSLCRRHHRFVHEGGYRIEENREGEIMFIAPSGIPLDRVCMPPTLEADGPILLRTANAASGVAIDARSGHPQDTGRVDYGLAVQILLERDVHPSYSS